MKKLIFILLATTSLNLFSEELCPKSDNISKVDTDNYIVSFYTGLLSNPLTTMSDKLMMKNYIENQFKQHKVIVNKTFDSYSGFNLNVYSKDINNLYCLQKQVNDNINKNIISQFTFLNKNGDLKATATLSTFFFSNSGFSSSNMPTIIDKKDDKDQIYNINVTTNFIIDESNNYKQKFVIQGVIDNTLIMDPESGYSPLKESGVINFPNNIKLIYKNQIQ